MDRLSERLTVADSALTSFEELAGRDQMTPLERDAAILRFQYSFEAVWKAAQHVLREREGVEVGSPKHAIRACLVAGLLDPDIANRLLELADDRNLTVHTYNEILAIALASRLPSHASLLRNWWSQIK